MLEGRIGMANFLVGTCYVPVLEKPDPIATSRELKHGDRNYSEIHRWRYKNHISL
jgi:hypothetical protein